MQKINKTPFELCFGCNHFKKDEIITSTEAVFYTPWYLKIIGFNIMWDYKIMTDPIIKNNTYCYVVKLVKSKINWFNIKIK